MPFDECLHFLRRVAEIGRHVVERVFNSGGARWNAGMQPRQVAEIFFDQIAIRIEIGMLEEERRLLGKLGQQQGPLLAWQFG